MSLPLHDRAFPVVLFLRIAHLAAACLERKDAGPFSQSDSCTANIGSIITEDNSKALNIIE